VARGDDNVPADEGVRRSVARTVAGGLLWLLLLAVVAGWSYFGFYQLEPGQAAVILRLGRHVETVQREGLHWNLPPPFVTREVVPVSEVASEEFGVHGAEGESAEAQRVAEASMQTGDNNIVRVSFAVQYQIKDAHQWLYRVQEPREVLRDASQAAMREVVGRMTIDGVLSERRGEVKLEATETLQDILDAYDSGILVQDVQLQEVQPPPEVRDAFDDVIAAAQDASRAVNEAEGFRNEVIPNARGEAAELRAQAEGYREATIADATGAAARFGAVVEEYRKAPEVTEKRLYLETMEAILPEVQKVIIEPGTASVLPYLPLGRDGRVRPPEPSP